MKILLMDHNLNERHADPGFQNRDNVLRLMGIEDNVIAKENHSGVRIFQEAVASHIAAVCFRQVIGDPGLLICAKETYQSPDAAVPQSRYAGLGAGDIMNGSAAAQRGSTGKPKNLLLDKLAIFIHLPIAAVFIGSGVRPPVEGELQPVCGCFPLRLVSVRHSVKGEAGHFVVNVQLDLCAEFIVDGAQKPQIGVVKEGCIGLLGKIPEDKNVVVNGKSVLLHKLPADLLLAAFKNGFEELKLIIRRVRIFTLTGNEIGEGEYHTVITIERIAFNKLFIGMPVRVGNKTHFCSI